MCNFKYELKMTMQERKFQRAVFSVAVTAFIGVAVAIPTVSPQEAPIQPCQGEEYRQFDFWIGEWDLSWGDSGRGSNRITLELDSCVIVENFTTAGEQPFVGRSVSTYNKYTEQWHQTWVDNNGTYLDFTGGLSADSMILIRRAVRGDTTFHQRMVFFNIADDSLDWSWQRSDDGGSTWKILWHIDYTRQE